MIATVDGRKTWTRYRFGDVISNVSDRVDDPSAAGVERYVGLEHIDPGSMTITRWGTPDQVEAQKLRFQPGDVIFGRRRAYQRKVARADFEGICSAHALVLRAKLGLVDPDFLPVFLSSDVFLNRAIAISVGSLSPTVNWGTLATQEFDLPPIEEQRAIADLLWAVQRNVGGATHMLSALDLVVPALLLDLERVDDMRTVADVLQAARAGGTPLRSHREYYGGAVPWLKSGELPADSIDRTTETITDLGLRSSSTWLVPPRSTLVAMYGDGSTRGEVGYTAIALATNQAVLALVPAERNADARFLYHWMSARRVIMREISGGSSQKNLSKTLILSQPFPNLGVEAQAEVAARIDAVLVARRSAALVHGTSQDLFRGLLARCLDTTSISAEGIVGETP